MPALDEGVTSRGDGAARDPGFGRLPAIALCAGAGLLVCSIANALSRETLAPSPLIYWAGLLVIALPIFLRLSSSRPSPGERLALVSLLGVALYGVKVVHDSPLFTFPDEFIHAFNANQVAQHHHLFRSNPILPVTARYPGLEGATSALMTMTGMSSFAAGTVIVGTARLTFVMALFFLFRRLSGSPRAAGLGVAIYTGSSNFLLWNAQFSYESLALPLLAVVLMAFAERDAAPRSWAGAWTVPIVLGMVAIVVTHHLTSYGLAAIFVVLALVHRVMRAPRPNPWPFALLALGLSIAWLVVVASSTVGYLSPVVTHAVNATFETVSGEAAPRTLFHGAPGAGGSTPLLARVVALAAVALLAVGLPFGLRQAWRRHRSQPLAVVLALGAVGFFATLALRFTPAAWETGTRAGEFLFIGLAFVVALAAVEWGESRPARRLGRGGLAGGLALLLVGGAISGWPWDAQLAQPIRATAGGGEIESEPLALARWVSKNLPGRRFAASEADARLLLDPGGVAAIAGSNPDVKDIVATPRLSSWQLPLLRRRRLRYVVADRRRIAADNVRGYFFAVGPEPERLLPKGAVRKFIRIPAARVFQSGHIVLYHLEGRR